VLEQSLLYSEKLGIDLTPGTDAVYFRWFLASLLFGARITETIAKNTYRAFLRHGLTSPGRIIGAGWDFLVNPIMREGGYVRYDGRKSAQVLRDCERLLTDYRGSLRRLHEAARDARELEATLLTFYGVGPVTANIFLRRAAALLGQGRSRAPANREDTGEEAETRSRALSSQEPRLRQGGSRPHPQAARALMRRKKPLRSRDG
jgi:hypothetical protein